MNTIMSSTRSLVCAVMVLCLGASTAYAGGPLILCAPGVPFAYGPGPIPYYTDIDDSPFSPVLTLAEADVLTAMGFAEWSAVTSSSFSAVGAGTLFIQDPSLDEDIDTAAELFMVVGVDNGGGFSVIYDDDGTLTAALGGGLLTLGIAGPDFASGCTLTESWAVINLGAVDPGDMAPIPGAAFGGVFTHEFGHAINLAHSQTVGNILFSGDGPEPGACASAGYGAPAFADVETMHPFICVLPGCTGIDQATVNLDDIASISNLYPTGGWPGTVGTISGTVFDTDGVTPIGGVNVVARNMADPFGDAVSALSGDFTQTAGDGSYTLNGLTIGATYTVHVEEIVAGMFSQTPVSVADEEYWNDALESNMGIGPSADPVCSFTTITASAAMAPKAGAAAVADIMLNDPLLPVELTSFDAVADGGDVILQWETASETNNAGFEIQHRHLENDFESVDFVEGVGTTLEQQAYSYRVTDLEPGWHLFRLKQIDFDGTFEYHPDVEVLIELSDAYALSAAHPNPFNPQTQVTLMVATKQRVTIEVYDVMGRRVGLLHEGLLNANERHRFVFHAGLLPNGLYFYRVTGERFSDVKSMMLVK